MAHHEDEAGELLWKYIEALREADDPEAVNFVARTPADLTEYAAFRPVADALHETLRQEATEANGEDEPPAALVAAIQGSRRQAIRFWILDFGFWIGQSKMRKWRLAVGGLAVMAALALLIWRSVPHASLPTVTLRVHSMIHDHEEFVQNPAKMTVRGSDPTQVAAAVSPQIGYPVVPVDLSLAGANLLGGRRCSLDGQVIAFFMYRVGNVPVSVYELRAPRCRLPGMAERVAAGRRYLSGTDGRYNVLAWRRDDCLYVIVSALGTERLIEMAQHLSGGATNDEAGETL